MVTAGQAETEDFMAALGLGSDLPPLAGGTDFGSEEAAQPRMRWQSAWQFRLMLTGYCIGLGNVWRFPYLCGSHGGGAFVLAYIVMLVLCASPLFICECILGQKFQKGPIGTFRKMAPKWVGLAYVPAALTPIFLLYYQVVVAYTLHYFLMSFQYPLPWMDADPARYFGESFLKQVDIGGQGSHELNGVLLLEYFATWAVTVVCLVRGIHSAGKAAAVMVVLPVLFLTILFFEVIGLDGAVDGLKFFLLPRWEYLLSLEMWGVAAGQILFSLSPGTGTCIALCSYHDKEYKGLLRDSVVIIICNSVFSLFGGIVIFAVVGNLAYTKGESVDEIATAGEGLAFIVFAEGLSNLGGGYMTSIFSAMFFITLFCLGLDSSFAAVATMQTYVNDYYLSKNPGKKISTRGSAAVTIAMGCGLFACGLPYVTRCGPLLLEITDHFAVTYTVVLMVFLEYIMIGHFYTAEEMLKDVRASTGVQTRPWTKHLLRYVAPSILLLVLSMLVLGDITSGFIATRPSWAVAIFGFAPVFIAIGSAMYPTLSFGVNRYLWGHIYPAVCRWTPESLDAVRQRAQGGGHHHRFQEDPFIQSNYAEMARPTT